MNNYKLIIQYDGTDYAGWQIQSGEKTIQQTITDAVETITKKKVNLIGSGRTDSGVHALGQSANFRIDDDLDTRKFIYSLNSILPHDISVLEIEKRETDFNSRFDAKERTYLYFLSKYKSPFFNKYSYHYHGTTDLSKLNSICSAFLGENDFTSFSKKNTVISNKNCKVFDCKWYEFNDLIIFEITANRFLHGMVRTITGTILKAIESGRSTDYIKDIFQAVNREAAPMAVPAKGLFLYKVKY